MSPFIRPPTVTPLDRYLALGLFLWLLVIGTVTFAGLPQDLEGEAEIQTTSALVRTRQPALSGTPEAETLAGLAQDENAEVLRAVAFGAPPRAEQLFARQGIGGALAGVPFFLLGRAVGIFMPEEQAENARQSFDGLHRSEYVEHLAFTWRGALFFALTAGLLLLCCRRLGLPAKVAFWTGATYALTTFAWVQSRNGRGDTFACFCLLVTVHAWLGTRERYQRLQRPRRWRLLLAGAALGLAVLTRPSTLPVALTLTVAFVTTLRGGCERLGQWRASAGLAKPPSLIVSLAWVLLPFLFSIALGQLYGDWRFGAEGLAGALHPLTTEARPQRLAEWTLSPGVGLVWFAPAMLLAPFGIWLARSTGKRAFAWLALAACAAQIAVLPFDATSPFSDYGPRPLLSILPIAWIGVGFVLNEAEGRRGLRFLAGVLLGLGLIVQVPGTLVDRMTHEDLSRQAVRLHWPDEDAAVQASHRLWSFGMSPPWSHWRILRHRIAGQGEVFSVSEIFHLPSDAKVRPGFARHQGFAHLGWVDFGVRVRGPLWPIVLIAIALAVLGTFWTARGLRPRR